MKTDDLRKIFLEFFRSKGHTIVPSDSLVPKDDPTLLFTGAGMNQFKEKFLGRNITYRRATSSQKCLRTADLDNVGVTSGHHTFFEMLGNFSFGDYFKKEAIQWSWEFFTKTLKIKRELLWVSVYKDDEETYNIWKDVVRVPSRKIIKFGAKENFWPSEAPEKGPNGPCGPCSEIFYDYGKDIGCGNAHCDPRCDCGRFVEVWNLVFTQFDRQPDGSLKNLPNKNIDTGMGLERLASVMQGVKTNFDIDIFKPITAEIKRMAAPDSASRKEKINAIADHIRAVVFCIADGVTPSNEERGYVVRKLIRRSALHGKDIGIKDPYLYKLAAPVSDVMGGAYPAVSARRDDIAQVIKKEEDNFLNVLETQVPKVEEAFGGMQKSKDAAKAIAGAAFNFYDTYGMPYDMLEEIAEKFNLKIDEKLFEALLEKQREQSRAKSKIKGEIFSQDALSQKVEALGLNTEFLGYEAAHADATVLAVLDSGEIILDRTPFYGESGGQAGDCGTIETNSGVMEVENTKKIGETIIHIGRLASGRIIKGEMARAAIDIETRKKTMLNHTATHLLQAALRKVLGEHVRQTGSLVDKDHLRFDFTHMKKMEDRELARVEELVNDCIKSALPVKKELKTIGSAKAEGATALFGEKYGDIVRVVTISDVSKELCGGTHVDNTGEIGVFKITSESSIASGVRRIEAMTGPAAEEWIAKRKEAASSRLKAEREKEAVSNAMDKRLAEEVGRVDSIIGRARDLGGVKVVSEIIDGMNMEGLRILSDKIKEKEKSAVIILSTKTPDKASFIITITEDLVKKDLNACLLAKEMAALIDGSGGGKNIFAQGGGKAPSNLETALESIIDALKRRLT